MESVDRPKRGTKVVLYLRKEAKEFLDGYRLRSIINKYSDHISLPIVMPKEGEDEKGEETVNTATALWTRNKKDIKEEEYNEFYKTVSHDFEDPLCHIHNRVEGKLEYYQPVVHSRPRAVRLMGPGTTARCQIVR